MTNETDFDVHRAPPGGAVLWSALTTGVTAVTPTRRLAHWILRQVETEQLAAGHPVWPTPDVVTWSELLERMFDADRRAGRSDLRWLGEAGARLAWERLVRRDPALAQVIAPEGIGRSAQLAWRRLHEYQIPIDALESSGSPEVAAFARWVGQFSDWLQAGRWLDAAQASVCVDPRSAPPRLRLVGFDTLTPAQETLLDRLEGAGVELERSVPEAGPGNTGWFECLDREAEIEAAARWAAARLLAVPGQHVGIVVPDLASRREDVRRTLDRVLAPGATVCGGPAPESVAYELAAARALGARPLVAAALRWLAALCHETDLAACSELLRDPFCRGADVEAAARARLDAWLRRHAPARLPLARLGLHAAERGCPLLADAVQAGLQRVATWPRKGRPSDWSHAFDAVLRAVGWPGQDLDSAEHQAWQRWQSLLGEFGASDDVVGNVSRGEALRLVRDLAAGVLFEPQEIRAPLLVIDAQTSAGMRFDALWVCGLDATRWPAAATPDPFLPLDWQARRGLPGATAEIAGAEARRTLTRLCASAPEVVLSVPQFEDEAPLIPSALLNGIPGLAPPATWSGPDATSACFAARPPLERLVDGAMPPLPPGDAAQGGARLLELQAACPFRAQSELRLGARPIEEPAFGLDAATRGELVHETLRRLWESLCDQERLLATPDARLRAQVRAAIASAVAPLQHSADEVLRELLAIESAWLEARVMELLSVDRSRAPFAVIGTEEEHAVRVGGLTLRLRIDRVDRLPDGSLAVIDYKTGGEVEVTAWLDERPKSPQLPLYVEALGADRVTAVAFGRVRTAETGYVGLASDDRWLPGVRTVAASSRTREYGDWRGLLAAWHRRLEALAREHLSGDARLAPDPPHACRHCHLPALCRIAETSLGATVDEGGEHD